jgi:uncharacterized protein (TIGR01777 family)
MIIAITGASGFIGPHLIDRLQREGYSVRAFGRSDPRIEGVEFVGWNSSQEPPAEALRDVDAVIHLAGEPVAQRWSSDAKQRIRDSRILGTRNLVSTMGKLSSRPSIFVCSSAVGYYGDCHDEVLTETSPPGDDFLARTCVEWEHEARHAGEHGLRVCLLRTGLVLGREGGALKKMTGPFKAGIGGPVGSGKQWVSWIHMEDIVGLIVFALQHERIYGAINAASPNPVRNSEFARELGAALHRPAHLPVPAVALKVMFGEMAQVVLSSQRVIPEAATRAGYSFRYTELPDALHAIFT